MAESDFWEKFFSGRKPPFLQIFIGLFPYISLFFHSKTLFIAMPIINHGLIVNKTDFWSRNLLKIAGTADFRRKNDISWISRAVLYIFSWNFVHWCKMVMSKMWPSPIFEKHIFLAENAGNMPEKPVFWHFLEILSLVFSIFCSKMCISNTHNMAESDFWEKFFSGRKCRKYAGNRRFCRFSLDFFLIFRCFFT